MEALKQWASDYAGTFLASVSGAAIHVTVVWQHPLIAVRHFIVAVLVGSLFGPGLYSLIEIVTPLSGDSIKSGTVGAAALGGVYAAEGVIEFWKRWSKNPNIPFPWRKS